MIYKPTVYNQNVVAYVNGNEDPNESRNSEAFLPSITGSSHSKKGQYAINESPLLQQDRKH